MRDDGDYGYWSAPQYWQQRWSDRLLDRLAPAPRRRATTRYPGVAERLSRAAVPGSYRTTVLAFHANGQGGDFECLALMPPVATSFSPESGDFEVHAMYVTGKVTSVSVRDGTAVLHGTATVTGIGAGANLPFTFVAQAGGPGTTAALTVSGSTFHEILLEGQITVH